MQKPAPPHTFAHAASQPLPAIGLMCVAWALFACLDTTAKYLVTATDLPTVQLVWTRFLGQLIAMVVALGLLAVPSLLRTRKLKVQIGRSFLLLGSTAFNFLALRHLRLDQTTTIGFLTPLTVAVLAGPLLGEWIGWRRAIAVLVGFCGILVAVRPGFTHVHPAVLFSLCSMLCYAMFSIVTRYLAPFDRAEVTLFYSLLAGTVILAPLALTEWVWPSSRARPLPVHPGAPLRPGLLGGAVPLHRAPHAFHRGLHRVRACAGPVDTCRRGHRDPVGAVPAAPRARHRARPGGGHHHGSRAAAVMGRHPVQTPREARRRRRHGTHALFNLPHLCGEVAGSRPISASPWRASRRRDDGV